MFALSRPSWDENSLQTPESTYSAMDRTQLLVQ